MRDLCKSVNTIIIYFKIKIMKRNSHNYIKALQTNQIYRPNCSWVLDLYMFLFCFLWNIVLYVIKRVISKIISPPILNDNRNFIILEGRVYNFSWGLESVRKGTTQQREGNCEGVSCFLYWPVAPIYDLTFP